MDPQTIIDQVNQTITDLQTEGDVESAVNRLKLLVHEQIKYLYRTDLGLSTHLTSEQKEQLSIQRDYHTYELWKILVDHCHYPSVDSALRKMMKSEKQLKISSFVVTELSNAIHTYRIKLHEIRATELKEMGIHLDPKNIPIGREVVYGEFRYMIGNYFPDSHTVNLIAGTKTGQDVLYYIPVEKLQLF